jgi:hypothetical protein
MEFSQDRIGFLTVFLVSNRDRKQLETMTLRSRDSLKILKHLKAVSLPSAARID